MKLKCLIADDEQLARELIKSYVDKIDELELISVCKNGMEVRNVLNEKEIDLMFLDVQMPDLTGVELLKSLTKKPSTILTTAYQEHAIEGYQLNVADYLLKPISFSRFLEAVERAKSLFNSKEKTSNYDKDYIILKADHKIHKIKYKDITHVEGLREYVTFHTENSKVIVLKSLKKLEEELPNEFMRVHKSFIVNTSKLDSVYASELSLGKLKIPIGKRYKERVLGLFK